MIVPHAIINFAPQGSLIELSLRGLSSAHGCRNSSRRIIAGITKFSGHKKQFACGKVTRSLIGKDFPLVLYHGKRNFKPLLLRSEVGKIKSFSRRSRSRLNKRIASLTKNEMPLFVTLTYGKQYPEDFETFKYHLHLFCTNLLGVYPHAGILWKMEFQQRGAVHYHLFLYGVPLEEAQEYIPRMWHKIAGYGDENHLLFHQGKLARNENCVQKIRSWGGVVFYAGKYFAKLDGVSRSGRIWGSRGTVPISKIISFRVSMEEALLFRQQIILKLGFELKRIGFWCGNYSVDWLLLLNDIMDFFHTPPPPDENPNWDIDEEPDFENEIYF